MSDLPPQRRTVDDYSGFSRDWPGLEIRLIDGISPESVGNVFIGGDVCVARASHPNADMFGDLAAAMRAAQVAAVNLECPLTRSQASSPKSGPSLAADPSWADVLSEAGVDAVGVANNHIMDAGCEGLSETLSACRGAGIAVFGGGMRLQDARSAIVLRCGDARVALLAVAEHEFGIAEDNRPGAAPMEMAGTVASVQEASAAADAVVVLVHGGCEHYPLPSPRLRDYCHLLVSAGADAVLCQHSHVIGAIETVGHAIVSYGSGNLLFPYPGRMPAGWHQGYSLELRVCTQGLAAARIIPHRYDTEAGAIRILAGSEAEEFAESLRRLNARVADAESLTDEWRQFVLSRRRQYLATALGLSRPERLAVRLGLWPGWRLPRRLIPELLDVFSCESHNEAMVEVLTTELSRRG